MPVCIKHKEEKVKWGSKWKCKTCNKEYQVKWWKANKSTQIERVTKNRKTYKLRNMQLIIEYFKYNPCVDCGETDFKVLEFDHRDRTDKLFDVAKLVNTSSIEKLVNEISKCDVRCANCHRKRTAKQLNFYSYL